MLGVGLFEDMLLRLELPLVLLEVGLVVEMLILELLRDVPPAVEVAVEPLLVDVDELLGTPRAPP